MRAATASSSNREAAVTEAENMTNDSTPADGTSPALDHLDVFDDPAFAPLTAPPPSAAGNAATHDDGGFEGLAAWAAGAFAELHPADTDEFISTLLAGTRAVQDDEGRPNSSHPLGRPRTAQREDTVEMPPEGSDDDGDEEDDPFSAVAPLHGDMFGDAAADGVDSGEGLSDVAVLRKLLETVTQVETEQQSSAAPQLASVESVSKTTSAFFAGASYFRRRRSSTAAGGGEAAGGLQRRRSSLTALRAAISRGTTEGRSGAEAHDERDGRAESRSGAEDNGRRGSSAIGADSDDDEAAEAEAAAKDAEYAAALMAEIRRARLQGVANGEADVRRRIAVESDVTLDFLAAAECSLNAATTAVTTVMRSETVQRQALIGDLSGRIATSLRGVETQEADHRTLIFEQQTVGTSAMLSAAMVSGAQELFFAAAHRCVTEFFRDVSLLMLVSWRTTAQMAHDACDKAWTRVRHLIDVAHCEESLRAARCRDENECWEGLMLLSNMHTDEWAARCRIEGDTACGKPLATDNDLAVAPDDADESVSRRGLITQWYASCRQYIARREATRRAAMVAGEANDWARCERKYLDASQQGQRRRIEALQAAAWRDFEPPVAPVTSDVVSGPSRHGTPPSPSLIMVDDGRPGFAGLVTPRSESVTPTLPKLPDARPGTGHVLSGPSTPPPLSPSATLRLGTTISLAPAPPQAEQRLQSKREESIRRIQTRQQTDRWAKLFSELGAAEDTAGTTATPRSTAAPKASSGERTAGLRPPASPRSKRAAPPEPPHHTLPRAGDLPHLNTGDIEEAPLLVGSPRHAATTGGAQRPPSGKPRSLAPPSAAAPVLSSPLSAAVPRTPSRPVAERHKAVGGDSIVIPSPPPQNAAATAGRKPRPLDRVGGGDVGVESSVCPRGAAGSCSPTASLPVVSLAAGELGDMPSLTFLSPTGSHATHRRRRH